jgi:hypothetical protein
MRVLKIVLPAMCLSISACSASRESGTNPSPVNEFGIYLLDTAISARTAWSLPLESLPLVPEAFIRARDLSEYQWSTHAFTPSPALDSVLKQMEGLRGQSWGVPFVVMVGKQRIYLGAFWWSYSSLAPQVPYIDLITPQPHRIKPAWLPLQPDPRGDPRIRESLQAAGILKE